MYNNPYQNQYHQIKNHIEQSHQQIQRKALSEVRYIKTNYKAMLTVCISSINKQYETLLTNTSREIHLITKRYESSFRSSLGQARAKLQFQLQECEIDLHKTTIELERKRDVSDLHSLSTFWNIIGIISHTQMSSIRLKRRLQNHQEELRIRISYLTQELNHIESLLAWLTTIREYGNHLEETIALLQKETQLMLLKEFFLMFPSLKEFSKDVPANNYQD